MAKRIKQKEVNKLPHLRQELKTIQDYVAFSFKHFLNNEKKYSMTSDKATKDAKVKVLECLHKYSSQSWNALVSQNKYISGTEYIARDKLTSLNVSIPNTELYNEIKGFSIFRAGEYRICGYRDKNICYILWIDWDLTSYNHGT